MKKQLLVDGYNVLRSGTLYAHIGGDDHTHDAFNSARQALINDVAAFAGRNWRATVVFDGGGNPASRGEAQKVAGVEVIFSPAGTSADSVIEERARKAAEAGAEVLVVTSDAHTQWTVLGGKVTRMSAADFCFEAAIIHEGMEPTSPNPTPKTTLGERLDPQTRAKLNEKLRR
jgi:predicted RNA-binding protein with PIN domain